MTVDEDEGPDYEQLAWQVIPEELLVEMSKLSIEDVAIKLAKVLSYTNHKESLREAALLDVCVAAYWFGKEQKLTNHQLSAFFTVLHKLIGNCKSGMSMMENIGEFQKLLVGVGITEKCPLGQFSKEQAKWLTEYIMSSLFQHYGLYQYLLNERQDEETVSMKLPICIPPSCSSLTLPPLEEAVSEQFYLQYINPPAPSPEPTVSDSVTNMAEENINLVEPDILDGVSAAEVKTVIDKIAAGAITNFENEVIQKIKDKEKSIVKQLNQIEKTVK